MDTAFIRKHQQVRPLWTTIVSYGNTTVTLYKHTSASGSIGFMLAYRQDGKCKFDSFSDEASAVLAANTKARQLSTLGVKASQLTDDEMRMCVGALEMLKPLGVSLTEAVSKYVETVKIAGDPLAAANFFRKRHKVIEAKRVADLVAELILSKESRGLSGRYLSDLRSRLNKFSAAFQKNVGDVTANEVQLY
jgi:hypothetical protein